MVMEGPMQTVNFNGLNLCLGSKILHAWRASASGLYTVGRYYLYYLEMIYIRICPSVIWTYKYADDTNRYSVGTVKQLMKFKPN